MENEYRIECEECDNITIVLVESDDAPEFCAICGRRAEVEDISDEDFNHVFIPCFLLSSMIAVISPSP